jgi:hypothetical protein
MSADEQHGLERILGWFDRQLPIPNRFSRSIRRGSSPKAICWFKDGAARYIRRVRELAALLERHGVWIEMLRTQRPGYLVYEDEYQVAAVPFRDTGA